MSLFESIVLGKAHISGDTVETFVDEALTYNIATLTKEQISIVKIIIGQATKIVKAGSVDADAFRDKVRKVNDILMKM